MRTIFSPCRGSALAWVLMAVATTLAPQEAAAVLQHPRYDTYSGFSVDTTPVLPAVERHPSLYFAADRIAELQDRKADASSYYHTLWLRFRADAIGYLDDDMMALDENDRPRAAKTLAFWWILEGDSTALAQATNALLAAYEGVPQTGDKPYDEIYRATWLQNYAAAYDWVFDQLTPEQNIAIRQRIADETQYLRDNLMVGDRLAPRPHNHRSKPAWAMGTAALVLAEHDQAADWLQHALEAANSVTRYQFSSDGIYREGGHYWMYNAVNLIPFLWHYRNVAGVSLFEDYRPAFEWPIRIRTGRGQIPNVEDSYLKPAPTHMVAAAYRDAPTSLNPQADFAAICQWNFETTRNISVNYTGATVDVTWEIDEYILYDDSIAPAAPSAPPNQFLKGGQVVFRNIWEAGYGDRYLLFHGVAEADNHNHPDQLSFFLAANDALLVPDAGYGPNGFSDDRRNSWYLSAKAHNIVTADGYPPVTDHLIRAPYVYNVTPESAYAMDSEFFAFAEKRSGYLRPNDAHLRRAIGFIDQDFFVVADLAIGTAEHTYRTYLHGRGVFERAGHYASWTPWDNRYGTEARLDAFFFPHAVDIADATSYISLFKDERYERHVELTRTGRSAAFLQLLLPARKDAPVPEVTDLSSDSFAAAQLTRADTADYFFLQPQPADQSLDDFTTDATFAWMRSTAGRWQQLAIREAVGFAAGSLTLTATSPATLALDAATPGLLRIAHPGDWMGARLELAYVGTDEVREVLANGQPIPYVRQEGHLIVGLGPLSRATTPVPDGIERLQAYPNPFQRQVMLEAPVRRPGTFAVNIYDMLGRHIVTLEGLHSPGSLTSRIAWNGRAASGTEVPAGVYLLRWTDAEGSLATGRVVRMR